MAVSWNETGAVLTVVIPENPEGIYPGSTSPVVPVDEWVPALRFATAGMTTLDLSRTCFAPPVGTTARLLPHLRHVHRPADRRGEAGLVEGFGQP
jgi:hypothetical protein